MSHIEALKAYKVKDYESALNMWLEEAKQKSDQAMTNIGLMYLKGEGIEKDYVAAREWFERASLYDNESANYNLALMYQTKIGVDEDIDKAIDYFRRAVKKNHTGASFRLGLLLLKDRTNEEQVKEGFEAMLSAAQGGHPMAVAQMGGVEKPVNASCELNDVFRNLSMGNQLEMINDALERYIRPMLIQDGGNIMLIDYVNYPNIEVRLAYQGNCAGCSMAATSTYDLIKNTLSDIIDENIRVYII